MDRLSSCYFCGAALDATLGEHPVVPSSLHPGADAQQTVVLCRTCRRKLDAVLDTVVDAVEANAGDVTAGTDSGADGEGPTGSDIESTLGDDEEILSPLGDDEPTAEEAAEASGMEFGDDRAAEEEDAASDSSDDDDDTDDGASTARKYTRSRGAGFRKEDDGPEETGSLTGGAFDDDDDEDSTDSGSLTGDAFADDDAGSGGTDSADTSAADPLSEGDASGSSDSSSSGTSSGGADDASAAESAGRSSDSSGDGSGSGESGGNHRVSMSRLENTKVMRLLENREFPVDKAEFVTVAANAYQVSQSDCEKVIDLAVEHDLLREENGQLYGGDA